MTETAAIWKSLRPDLSWKSEECCEKCGNIFLL